MSYVISEVVKLERYLWECWFYYNIIFIKLGKKYMVISNNIKFVKGIR